MLRFLLGRAGSGKTVALREMAAEQVQQGKSCFLLVPEQNSFETERQMLHLLGAKDAQLVQVCSFRRLTDYVYRLAGRPQGTVLSDGGRRVLMSLALEQVADRLERYRQYRSTGELIDLLLLFAKELKLCGGTPAQLQDLERKVQEPILRQKLHEIGLILSAFEALIAQSYLDPLDDLTRILPLIEREQVFAKAEIFIDGFRDFTKQELSVLRLLLQQASQVTVAVGAEDIHCKDPYSLFAAAEQGAQSLWNLAKEQNVPIGKSIHLTERKRFRSAQLSCLERCFFAPEQPIWTEKTEDVQLFCGETRFAEAQFAAREIRRLVMQEGYRYGEITIAARNLTAYRDALDLALTQYEVPYFLDDPQPVVSEPIMQAVLSVFRILRSHFDTEAIFAYLKTGMVSGFSAEMIGELENYTYLWGIRGAKWKAPWTANPDGFGEFTEQGRAQLHRLNQWRAQLIAPLTQFAKDCECRTGLGISKAIYDLLCAIGAEQCVLELTEKLQTLGQFPAAEEQLRLWGVLMDTLDQMAGLLGETAVTAERYGMLLQLLLEAAEAGKIPEGMDQVTVGELGRMRPADQKVVLLLGVNQEEFPAQPSDAGIFCDRERQDLMALQLPLTSGLDAKEAEERYLTYTAMTMASEKLYVGWCGAELSGEKHLPSVLIRELRRIFPQIEVVSQKAEQQDIEKLALTEASAFALLAQLRPQGNQHAATLQALLLDSPAYRARCAALERVVKGKPRQFADPKKAKLLFPAHLYLSASQIERFYQCPFQYFCQHGLRARERNRAEIGVPEYGSFMHYLLEQMFRTHGHKTICAMDDAALSAQIKAQMEDYIEKQFGGKLDKTERFLYRFARLADAAQLVIRHIAQELSQSKFQPIGYEMRMGPQGDLPPLQLETGQGSVTILGTIDRVDCYTQDDTTYVRIIDYKTGGKKLKLEDLCNGTNLQMLIYLAAIVESRGYAPAAVLYALADQPELKWDDKWALQDASPAEEAARRSEIEKQIRNGLRMDGLLLQDPAILKAMDEKADGSYLMAKLNKDGTISKQSGCTVTREKMQLVLEYMQHLVRAMADSLHRGETAVRPLKGGEQHDGCKFCPYAAICGYEENSGERAWRSFRQEDALAEMEQEVKQDGKFLDESTAAGD